MWNDASTYTAYIRAYILFIFNIAIFSAHAAKETAS